MRTTTKRVKCSINGERIEFYIKMSARECRRRLQAKNAEHILITRASDRDVIEAPYLLAFGTKNKRTGAIIDYSLLPKDCLIGHELVDFYGMNK